MQFNPFFCGQNCGQQIPCNTSPYTFRPQCPEVLPEYEIATTVNPDGSLSYFFIPTNKRGFLNHNLLGINSNPIFWNSYSNQYPAIKFPQNPAPLPAAFHGQQYPGLYNVPLCKPDLATYCNNFNIPNAECNNGFQLKFHNDTCTSTTDLHYFFPDRRVNTDRSAQAVAAVRHCGCNHESGHALGRCSSDSHVMFVDEEPPKLECCAQMERKAVCRCGRGVDRGAGPSPARATQTPARAGDELRRALERRRTDMECCVLRQ